MEGGRDSIMPNMGTSSASPNSTPSASDEPLRAGVLENKRLFGFTLRKSMDKNQQPPQSSTQSPTQLPTQLPTQPSTQSTFASSISQPSLLSTSFPTLLSTVNTQPTSTSPTISQPQQHGWPTGPRLAASPRVVSPAGSQIFERDVQDGCTLLAPSSPAIPAHLTTDNHIPPVLDASSEAITDDHLDPERVEIITHTSHLPAALAFTSLSEGGGFATWAVAPAHDDYLYALPSPPPAFDRDDTGSNYGSIDAGDVRRLSFISFADVVLAEHAGGATGAGGPGSHDTYLAGRASFSYRSPSPMRSPVSSRGPETSPPTSSPGSVNGELSPARKTASPLLPTTSFMVPPLIGTGADINVETMSQALRRTGGTDLTGLRSSPTSPTEAPFSRS